MELEGIFDAGENLRVDYENAVKSLNARGGVLEIFHNAGLCKSRDALTREILDVGVNNYGTLVVSNVLFRSMAKNVEDTTLRNYFFNVSKDMCKDIELFYDLVTKAYKKGELMRLGMYKKD